MEGDIRVEWVYTGGPAKTGIIRCKHVPGGIDGGCAAYGPGSIHHFQELWNFSSVERKRTNTYSRDAKDRDIPHSPYIHVSER